MVRAPSDLERRNREGLSRRPLFAPRGVLKKSMGRYFWLRRPGICTALLVLTTAACTGPHAPKQPCSEQLNGRYRADYQVVATNCDGLTVGEQILGTQSFGQWGPSCQVSGPVWDTKLCRVHLLTLCESPKPLWDRPPPTYQSFDLSCEDAGCQHLSGETSVQLPGCLVVMSVQFRRDGDS
jgi:hypothetical protein